MDGDNENNLDDHTKVILDFYSDRGHIGVLCTAPDVIVNRYFSKIMSPDELRGKIILELGAGCSQYIPVFLKSGCAKYYANDIIPERLAVTRSKDPRYCELIGDFRTVSVPEPVDLVFANLTMMYLQPILDEVVTKISDSLKRGGIFLSFDPNYFCPLSIYRHLVKRTPARLFNPFRYAEIFRRHGFEIEKTVPLTPPLPWTAGHWLLGTNFWLRARKVS